MAIPWETPFLLLRLQEEIKMQGIYKITNKDNNKVYIGQASNLKERISEHKKERFVPIDMWINMIGVEHFDFEILEEGHFNQTELDEKEREYIKLYESQNKEKGQNKQDGGFNNSIGEGNGRARLTQEDVINIRKAYANHESCKQTYELYKDKITYNSFQGVWQGRSWSTVMPEVFTEENKNWYKAEQNKTKATLTTQQVLEYRKYYVDHSRDEVYQKFLQDIDNQENTIKKTTFLKILSGDVRENSIYREVPLYKKNLKKWYINGEPVSTIPESGE